VTAPITSDALLAVSESLAGLDDPTTVARRRAVSSAYYALFHGLIADAVRRAIGDDVARQEDRHTVSRWYSHGDMRTVSQWVVRLARGEAVPTGVATLLGDPPPDLVELARAFIQLQEARHEADYDHAAQVDEDDAWAAIDTARAALARRPLLTGGRPYANYLALLLGGPRVARSP
jgi:hypothetical protein